MSPLMNKGPQNVPITGASTEPSKPVLPPESAATIGAWSGDPRLWRIPPQAVTRGGYPGKDKGAHTNIDRHLTYLEE